MNTGAPDTSSVPVKKVLVIRYSQSGQLNDLADSLLAPLRADPHIAVHVETLQLRKPFPFPWGFFPFLDAFPESYHLVPPELAPLSLSGDEDFDLVVLPYQVWFLAPSQPVTAFVKHPVGRKLLQGRPVVTLIACRNMWLMAHEKMKALLGSAGARLVDNVVYVDPGPTLATFFTTPKWVLSGSRKGFWGMPDAGLDAAQIRGARRFGRALVEALHADREKGTQPMLAGLGAVSAEPRLFISEKAGSRSFHVWGKLLMAAGRPGAPQRVPLLALYVVFLIVMIVTVVPTSLVLQAVLRPFMGGWLSRIKTQYEQPSGSSTERSHLYED
ncbi:MAG: dialkylresorcinol condensing enzyme [Rhizobacter sp.]|nr:dialkylresorcinol condensing enzyme [Rhizobacter sp.]